MSIKAKFARTYRASKGLQKGKLVRVYLVSASTDEELQQYEESQGDYLQHDDDTGKPLWKTTDAFIPSVVTLEWNYDGSRVYPKFDTVSKIQSATESLGTGLLGQAFAQRASDMLLASLGLTAFDAPVATPATVPQQSEPSAVTPQEEPVAEGETPFTDESGE
jgi:hypothetical protein